MAKYILFDKEIEFADSAERFFDMQKKVWDAVGKARAEFDSWYNKCNGIYTVLKNYEIFATETVIKYAEKPLLADLTKLELYDISEDYYDDRCLIFDALVTAFEDIADRYNSIIDEQEAQMEYREERKASRARVVGGGFGLSGALQGMATAGAINATSGLGHSMMNAVGNAISAADAASAKKSLYESSYTRDTLKAGIVNDIVNCFTAHMNLVNERKGDYIVSSFNSDRAGALFENAKKVADKQVELLVESFTLCPWNDELYEFIFKKYRTERKNIWDIGKRFCIDLRNAAEEAFAESYCGEARYSDEAARRVKDDILSQMEELGIKSSQTIDNIETDGLLRIIRNYFSATDEEKKDMFEKYDNYDARQSIKVDVIRKNGIWELAPKYSVRFSKEEAETILGKYYTAKAKGSEAEALIAKEQIKIVMKALSISESKTFDTLEIDCLTRLCVGYEKADEETCNKMIKAINEYDALHKNKKGLLTNIQTRIEAIWSKEDGEIFDNVFLNTDLSSPLKVKEALDYIKSKGRTTASRKYINALASASPDNIKKAQTFQKPIAKISNFGGIGLIILGIILLFTEAGVVWSLLSAAVGIILLVYYYNLKKAWNCLTLNGSIVHKMISLSGKEERNEVAKKELEADEAEKKAKFQEEYEKMMQNKDKKE